MTARAIMVLPDGGRPWVLALRDGEVVRLSARSPGAGDAVGRVYRTLSCHCGGMKDKPVELKRMARVYAAEERLNGR